MSAADVCVDIRLDSVSISQKHSGIEQCYVFLYMCDALSLFLG